MAAQSAWRGAVELGGFPVNVRLYNRLNSKRGGGGFRMLAPTDGLPVRQVLRDTDGNDVERSDTLKGIEVTKDEFVALSPEAVEAIGSMERSISVEPKAFSPIDSIDLSLASATYWVVADKDVPGADQPVEILWNGLRAGKLAYVTQVTMRAGSSDVVVALYAKDDGYLYAAAIPFADQLNEPPETKFEVNTKAEKVFSQFVEATHDEILGDFDPEQFSSEAGARRDAAVEAVLDGKTMMLPEAPKTASAPDLMAALEGAVKDADKPGTKTSAKKAKTKAAA